MKKIAITFPILKYFGGAELTAIKIANYLSNKNSVDLISCGSDLNKNIKKNIKKKINIIQLRPKNFILNYLCSKIIIIAQCYIMHYLKKTNYDKIISTSGEIVNKKKIYQLIHFPFFSLNIFDYISLGVRFYQVHKILIRFVVIFFLKKIFNINRSNLKKNITFANSKWSANKYSSVYKIKKNIFYNYLTYTLKNISNISFKEYEKRKNNFVILGRVTPDKKIHQSIKIFKKISDQNKKLNLKLIIIGPTPNKKYFKYCQSLAKNHCIKFTGFVSENKRNNILNNSKYGLHLFQNEHFGMAPCEMQNHNMIVFVYKNGGVIEFINNPNQQFLQYNELENKINFLLMFKKIRLKSFNIMQKNKKKIFHHNFYSNLDKILKK